MKIDGDTITFSSGRTAYANRGIIGINPELELSEGYDGGIDWPNGWRENPLTKEDVSELADHMIGLWQKFKETLTG